MAAYVVVLLSAGYGVGLLQSRPVRRANRRLEREVKERTAELETKTHDLGKKLRELDERNRQLESARRHAEARNRDLNQKNAELLTSYERVNRVFAALADALPGNVLDGKYQIHERIGQGGFATVYRGVQVALGRTVAVKVFRPTPETDSPQQLERFRREGMAASRVKSRHAVQMIDSGVSPEGIAYLVMELLRGGNLAALLKGGRALSLKRSMEIIVPVCDALAAAHSAGLIHRDIKPANIYLEATPEGEVVKVVDFGIAKALGHELDVSMLQTQTGQWMGTPAYMAPERFESGVYDARSDVYSVAVLLFRMLCGRRPFEGSAMEIVSQQLKADPPHARSFNPLVPEAASQLIRRALAKDVATRPGAKDFADELVVAMQSLPPDVLGREPTPNPKHATR